MMESCLLHKEWQNAGKMTLRMTNDNNLDKQHSEILKKWGTICPIFEQIFAVKNE